MLFELLTLISLDLKNLHGYNETDSSKDDPDAAYDTK